MLSSHNNVKKENIKKTRKSQNLKTSVYFFLSMTDRQRDKTMHICHKNPK